MKTLTITAIALVAGIGVAAAQNSPSNSQMKSAAPAGANAAFCEKGNADGIPLKCTFATLAQCQQQMKEPGASCVPNPKSTTGAR